MHLLNMFPENKLTKLKHDAEYISPGDKTRVYRYEVFRDSAFTYKQPEQVYERLPAIVKGLRYMSKYKIRRCLYDIEWMETVTGLDYS